MSARFVVGDSLAVLRSLSDASVDLVLTSPPFLALRSYLPADHADKALEMGSEATPGAFIDTLLDVVEECRRVLAPHGSLCFELGDTYAGSGGAGGDYAEGGMRDGQPMFRQGYVRNDRPNRPPQESPKAYGNGGPRPARAGRDAGGWPLDKSLTLIPELFRLSLAYGFNPLTGRTTPRWRVRNVVRWCRPNPPVGALADKVRPATSDLLIACTSRKRYFDLDAVRTPSTTTGGSTNWHPHDGRDKRTYAELGGQPNTGSNGGAPPLDHWWHDDVFDQDAWLISTEPYKGSHYATWPSDLCVKPIEAMCPREVCTVCGEPRRRIVDVSYAMDGGARDAKPRDERFTGGMLNGRVHNDHRTTEHQTTGWTDCGHGAYRRGVVLDPFCGSGTTLAVATGHSRDAIGIDLDERNADLARNRVGMFLTIEQLEIPA